MTLNLYSNSTNVKVSLEPLVVRFVFIMTGKVPLNNLERFVVPLTLKIRFKFGIELMLAVPFDSDPEIVSGVADKIDGIQVMGISPVGVQGSVFKLETIETIKKYRAAYPSLAISVDGGVKPELVQEILDAGADRMVMGSAIYGADDPRDELREIMSSV